jgi:hypothetical protein
MAEYQRRSQSNLTAALTGGLHSAEARIVIPPRSNAVGRIDTEPPGQRDDHIASINKDGHMK